MWQPYWRVAMLPLTEEDVRAFMVNRSGKHWSLHLRDSRARKGMALQSTAPFANGYFKRFCQKLTVRWVQLQATVSFGWSPVLGFRPQHLLHLQLCVFLSWKKSCGPCPPHEVQVRPPPRRQNSLFTCFKEHLRCFTLPILRHHSSSWAFVCLSVP